MSVPDNPLFRAFPKIPHAVAWVELFVCGEQDEDGAWDIMMRNHLFPTEVVNFLKGACDDEVALRSPGKNREARTEMDDASFLTYIMGKMGAV